QTIHLSPVGLHRLGNGSELVGGFLYQHFGQIALWHQHHYRLGKVVNPLGCTLSEVVAVAFTPFAVAFRKGSQTVLSDAVGVPEVVGKVNPLLGSVPTNRAVEALADA